MPRAYWRAIWRKGKGQAAWSGMEKAVGRAEESKAGRMGEVERAVFAEESRLLEDALAALEGLGLGPRGGA